MALTYAELFAGAGGMSLGLEAGGFHAVAHAEIEVNARAVLRHRWPNTRLDGDVMQINGADYTGITLLSGGSPCQDLSVAGKRAGLTGSRSSLFHEQCRIWRESDAPYLLWENVLGALSSNNGADFATVLSTIVGSPVAVPADGWRGGGGVVAGRDAVAAFRVLDLQHFGPPQRRVRVFILAARAGGVDPAEVLALNEGVCRHPSPRQQSRESAAAGAGGGAEGRVVPYTASRFAQYEEGIGQLRAAGGDLGGGSETILAFGWDQELNAAEELMGTLKARVLGGGHENGVLAFESTGGSWGVNEGDTSPPIKIGTGLGISSPPAVLAFSLMPQNSGKDYTGREGEVLQPLHTGGTGAGSNQGGDVLVSFAVRTANTSANGWGISEEVAHTLDLANGQSVCVTNGTPNVVCTTGDITHALTHEGADASEDGTGRGTPIVVGLDIAPTLSARDGHGPGNVYNGALQATVFPHGRPRRLTPLECERLMSWPDQWTATGRKDDGTEYALSDTARYRLCGNGVGSVCAEWIARRLHDAIQRQEEA